MYMEILPETERSYRLEFMTKLKRPAAAKPLNVVALIYDGLCTFEFGIAAEIFGLHRPDLSPQLYHFQSVAGEPGDLSAAGGLTVKASGNRQDLTKADILIVPGWRDVEAPVPQSMIKIIQSAHARGVRLVSICSGVFVLAAAGVLDGKKITTHWRYASALKKQYPLLDLDENILYSDQGQVLTSAGSSAGIDLCLHIVRSDYGGMIANKVARRLVMHSYRQGTQAQFIEPPRAKHDQTHRLAPILDHIRRHLATPLEVKNLAQKVSMSPRTFHRRFVALTGLAPMQWINQERLRHACTLLETTTASVDDIAQAIGHSGAESLRYHFNQKYDLSPSDYRKRFSPGPANDLTLARNKAQICA